MDETTTPSRPADPHPTPGVWLARLARSLALSAGAETVTAGAGAVGRLHAVLRPAR